jgi:hypothetical protein
LLNTWIDKKQENVHAIDVIKLNSEIIGVIGLKGENIVIREKLYQNNYHEPWFQLIKNLDNILFTN